MICVEIFTYMITLCLHESDFHSGIHMDTERDNHHVYSLFGLSSMFYLLDYPIPKAITDVYSPPGDDGEWPVFDDDDVSDDLLMSLVETPESQESNDKVTAERSELMDSGNDCLTFTADCNRRPVLSCNNAAPCKRSKLCEKSQETHIFHSLHQQEESENISDEQLIQIAERTEKQLEKL